MAQKGAEDLPGALDVAKDKLSDLGIVGWTKTSHPPQVPPYSREMQLHQILPDFAEPDYDDGGWARLTWPTSRCCASIVQNLPTVSSSKGRVTKWQRVLLTGNAFGD